MKKTFSVIVFVLLFSTSLMLGLPSIRSEYASWDVFYDANVLPEDFDPPFMTLWPPHIDTHDHYVEEISDGTLHISTLFPDYTPWYHCCGYYLDWNADSLIGFTVEARVKLIRYEGARMYGGMGFVAADNSSEVILLLNPDKVFEYWSDKSFDIDTTDDFHVYRVAVLGNEYWIYIDGTLRIQGNTGAYNRRGLAFGDLSNLANAEAYWDYVAYTTGALPPAVSAMVNLDPDTLNLKSKGEWITGYIELPEGYEVNDINVSSILLNNTIPVDPSAPTDYGDYDGDGVSDLMVKFDRAEVISCILANINMSKLIEERFLTITLTITGELDDGTSFQGSDTITIILPTHGKRETFPH